MTHFSQYIFSVTRPFAPYVIGLLVVALGRSLVVNAQPYLIQKIIDTISKTPAKELFSHIMPLVAAYVGIGICFLMLFRTYDFLNYRFVPQQKKYITELLMRKMMWHSAAFFQRHFAGNLTNKVNDVTIQTPEVVKIMTDHFATCFLTLAIVIVNVGTVHMNFAWGLIIWLTVFMGGSLWMLFSFSHYAHRAAEARSHVVGYIVDLLMNMVSVRLFARGRHEEALLSEVTKEVCQQERNRDRFFMKLHFFQGLSFSIFEAVCFWWLLQGVCQGTITAGQFVLVFSLNIQILDQFWDLGSEIRAFWEKKGYITQALRTIDAPQDMVDEPQATPLRVDKGTIQFEGVHFCYPGSPALFEDKTVEIPGGQKVGLVGYSGSGKSTFISLILRLYDVTSGRILIDGQDIRMVSRQSLYQSIAVVPQESPLFNRSLKDNIRYGRLDASDGSVYEAAYRAQIHDFIETLPQGYETLAGERGSCLSGGQRQRIAIARALLKDAPILVMDEATSALDVVTEERLKTAFDEVMRGKTVLVIAHRLTTLQSMDRLLVFDSGKIVQDGHHNDLIQQPGLYQRMWSSQSQSFLGNSAPAVLSS